MPRPANRRIIVSLFALGISVAAVLWQRPAYGGAGKIDNDGTIDFEFNFRFVPSLVDVADVKAATQKANEILCDATDGQSRIENVRLTSLGNYDAVLADVWFYPVDGRSNAVIGGIGLTGRHLNLYRDDLDADTIAHELGHFVFQLRDEYEEQERCIGPCFDGDVSERSHCLMQINYAGTRGRVECDPGGALCSEDGDCPSGGVCKAILTTEFCTAANHDPLQGEMPDDGMCAPDPPCTNCSERYNSGTMLYEQTLHSHSYGESCWQTLARLFPFLNAPSGLPDEVAPSNCFIPVQFTDALEGTDEYLLVVDRSGSMRASVEPGSSQTRLDYAKAAVRAFIDMQPLPTPVAGIESFASAATQDFELVLVAPFADHLKAAVDELEAWFGMTATGSALQLAANIFRASAQQSRSRTIVLLSDGQTNVGPDPVPVAEALKEQLGVTIMTVPVGAEADRAALAELAGISGGKTIDGVTGAELPAVYGELVAVLRGEALTLARTPSAVAAGIVEGFTSDANAWPFSIGGFATRLLDRLLGTRDARAQTSLPLSETFEIPVEPGAERLAVLLSSRNLSVTSWGPNFTLSGPAGESISQNDQTGAVRSDPYYRTIIVEQPSPGIWTLELFASGSVPQLSYVQAHVSNPLPNCLASAHPRIVPDGEMTRIFAEASYLTDLEGPITFEGTVRRPDGTVVPLTFNRDLDSNENSAGFDDFIGRGLYEASVTCRVHTGATPKRGESIFSGPEVPDIVIEPFERTTTVAFFFDSPDLPECTDDDCDGDGIPNDVEATDDIDGDGLPCDRDTDCDGDDVADADEGTGDSDGDGIPDFQDPDSDNDCLPDGGDPEPTVPGDPICGDGVVCPAEECDPPASSGESCGDGIDNDNNFLIDCRDPEGCPAFCIQDGTSSAPCLDVSECAEDEVCDTFTGTCLTPCTVHSVCREKFGRQSMCESRGTCGSSCGFVNQCARIDRDPAIIRFGRDADRLDRFNVHGRFLVEGVADPMVDGFSVLLTNSSGSIYEAALLPEHMRESGTNRKTYFYKDKSAKKTGGVNDGLALVKLKRRAVHGRQVLAFKVSAYGDFSAADEAQMALQVAVGPLGGFLEATWQQMPKGRGWVLRFKNL